MGKIAQQNTLKELLDFFKKIENSPNFYRDVSLSPDKSKARPVKVLGKNSDIDNVREDLIEWGGTYVFPTAGGIRMSIQSTSANDALAGTGVQRTELYYLDNGFVERDEEISLDGLNPVQTVASDILRVIGFHSIAAGTGAVADGTITCKNVAQTVTYSQITAGVNTALVGVFTVPKGYYYEIDGWDVGAGNPTGGRWAEFLLRATAHDDEGLIEYLSGVFHIWDLKASQDASFYKPFKYPIILPEKTDIKISASSDAANADASCCAMIDGALFKM